METRKIQEVGGGTFTVSLPQDWARTEDISQGQEVDVLTHIDGTLVVQTRDRETDPTGAVSILLPKDDTGRVKQVLWAAYTAGYTKITLTSCDSITPSQREMAHEVARTLTGISVTTDSKQQIVVQVLIDPEEISVRQLVRQLSFVALSMHREAMTALSDGEPVSHLSDSDDQVDRLHAITDRSFSRALSRLREVDRLGCTRSELFEFWSTARDLERIADHAERIGTISSELDGSVQEEHIRHLQDLAQRVQAVVEHAVSCIVNEGNTDEAYEALTLRTEIREQTNALDQRLFVDSTADYRLARILDSVRRTAEHGGNIAERGLQRAIRCRTTTDSDADAHGNEACNGDVVNATESGG